MKPVIVLFPILFLSSALLTGENGTSGVIYVDSAKVEKALTEGGMLAERSDVSAQGGHRVGPGQVEMHQKETDVFYMLEGEATFLTGGTMIGAKEVRPGQFLGKEIQGGETHHLKKGDVIVIPAGTPHWFKTLTPPVNYFVVKSIKP